MTAGKSGSSSALERVQTWYVAQCNGDWEHSYGVKIDTLDNPGWIVTVDLAETEWADLRIDRSIDQRSEHDWVQLEITNSQFIGCGGPRNLEEVLHRFLSIVSA